MDMKLVGLIVVNLIIIVSLMILILKTILLT
jgi:hypothetical protein